MKFEEVLPYFRNGKTIYRKKVWRDNKKFTLCIMNGNVKCRETTDRYTYSYPLNMGEFTIEDICAEDWEVTEVNHCDPDYTSFVVSNLNKGN